MAVGFDGEAEAEAKATRRSENEVSARKSASVRLLFWGGGMVRLQGKVGTRMVALKAGFMTDDKGNAAKSIAEIFGIDRDG